MNLETMINLDGLKSWFLLPWFEQKTSSVCAGAFVRPICPIFFAYLLATSALAHMIRFSRQKKHTLAGSLEKSLAVAFVPEVHWRFAGFGAFSDVQNVSLL